MWTSEDIKQQAQPKSKPLAAPPPTDFTPQEVEAGFDMAVWILSDIADFFEDLMDIRLNKAMRDKLIALNIDVTDYLEKWTEDEREEKGANTKPDSPWNGRNPICGCGHSSSQHWHGADGKPTSCAHCDCRKFKAEA